MADSSLSMAPEEPGKSPSSGKTGGGTDWWTSFRNYLIETGAEIKKVTWPSTDAWVNSSVITLLTILALAVIMAVYNAVISYIAGALFGTGA